MNRSVGLKLIVWLVIVSPFLCVRAWMSPKAPLSRSAAPLSAFQGFDLGAIFSNKPAVPKLDKNAEERERLKADLLNTCRQPKVERAQVEEKIAALAPFSPTKNSAASPLLQKDWILTWTTEKEINFFLDFGIASEVSQTINGSELGNLIAFKRGGCLSVSGTLSASKDDSAVRTEFKFDTATLDLAKWGKYQFPPVGQGWFDTIYLDDGLRVDTNSRDDILICTPRK
eukprot:scaffold4600_cov169-Amphora_coffeaeformis.AAC.3